MRAVEILARLGKCTNSPESQMLDNAINKEYKVSVFWYQVYQARLWERLLSSRGLPSDSTCVLKAEPGKLDIKSREPGILFINLPIVEHSSN